MAQVTQKSRVKKKKKAKSKKMTFVAYHLQDERWGENYHVLILPDLLFVRDTAPRKFEC
jgi:hypothetical protein